MTKKPSVEAGQVIEVPNYPFVRTTFSLPNFETGAIGDVIEGWKPGCDIERSQYDGVYSTADDVGQMILTVVSLHKPGRYPARVFFTRQWRDPDGKEFGHPKLRVCTQQTFNRLAAGYRHDFENDASSAT